MMIMKIFIKSIVLMILGQAIFAGLIYAEQEVTEMYATVTVNPIFGVSVDNEYIEFGHVDPGETKELNPQRSYNEVECISNKGIKWYLKLSLLGGVIGPAESQVGPQDFKWMIVSSTGDGIYDNEWHAFTEDPSLAYAGGSRDMTGEDVIIRFKYRVNLPYEARDGEYTIRVLYTMTETEL